MEFKDRLKLARRHAKLTQTQLAEAVGISQTSITDLERGKSQGTSFNVQMALACGVNPIWLASGNGYMLTSSELTNVGPTCQPQTAAKLYPLISWDAAGGWMEVFDSFQSGEAQEWIESHEDAGRRGYWLEVKGVSMVAASGASFPPSMRILVRPEDFELVSGKFYIAKLLDTGETAFRQYVRDMSDYLQPLNPSYKTIEMGENVKVIGRVVDAKLPKSVF